MLDMLLKRSFEVIEVRPNGETKSRYLRGNKKELKKDINTWQKCSTKYQMIGNKGMLVWF